ncbi:MAG: hypothetical protein KDD01_19940 [Phaeodactylibacter sp.]|nr:hypothetical protein [Phaeodactylibacter sp.]
MKRISIYSATVLTFVFFTVFFSGCKGDKKTTTAQPSTPATEVPETPNPPQPATADATDTGNTADSDTTGTDGASSAQTGAAEQPAPREKIEVAPIDNSGPQSVTSTTAPGEKLRDRAVDDERLSIVLDLIAQDLEAQKLEYKSELGQDCSGIYHKIKDQIQRKVKAFGDKSKYIYPTYTEDRNTRQIATWYHRHNNLYIVQDPLADRNKIRPGSVMFFARTDEKFSKPDIATLTNADVFQHDQAAGKGKIYHVGVVTKVEKDENGNVVRYTLMHGRNSKYTASRTSGNYDGPGGYKKTFAKFPFGNWNQQWVAVANIETPVE